MAASGWKDAYTGYKWLGICPLSLVAESDLILFQDVMRFINHNILPDGEYGNGFLNQTMKFCQAYDIVAGEIGK